MYYRVNYIAKGIKQNKIVEALNSREASQLLKKELKNAIVTKVEKASAPADEMITNFINNLKLMGAKNMPESEKIGAIRQIAVMTDAGLPIHDVLEDIVENNDNKVVKEVFGSVANDINAGKSMSAALEPHADKMGHIVMAMTALGEKTGNFPEAYHKLADILENMRENKEKFKKAMRYPKIVTVAIIAAFVTVIMAVVPKFRKIFEELHADLPIATKFLLSTESFFRNYGVLIIVGLAVVFFAFKFFYKNNLDFRYKIDKFTSNRKLYLIGELVYLSNMYNFTLVFGALIKAGIPVSEALVASIKVVDNLHIKKKLEIINTNIGRGVSLSKSFEDTDLFENMSLQMVRAGENSGQLDAMLGKVREYYNMKFQNLIDNLSAYIEPIMLAMIAAVVLLLALGIFMPMWDLGKAAKG